MRGARCTEHVPIRAPRQHSWGFLRRSVLGIFVLALVLAACIPSQTGEPTAAAGTTAGDQAVGSCSLSLPAEATDEEAIRAVLLAESRFMVAQDINALMRLWAEDSSVVDAKNTPDDPSDNQSWLGRDAIRHRYVRTVFPGAPSEAQPQDLEIQIDGQVATVRATTHIGEEISPAGDRWTLIKVDGCWLIQNLTYNLETLP